MGRCKLECCACPDLFTTLVYVSPLGTLTIDMPKLVGRQNEAQINGKNQRIDKPYQWEATEPIPTTADTYDVKFTLELV
ncbi:MAG: hypothetical protein ABL921_35765 [Pirellula sp.]